MTLRNSLSAVAARRARQLEAEGRIEPRHLPGPSRPFCCQPGDIKIAGTAPDGALRTQEQALEIARRREPRAEYVGRDARWIVFRRAR